MRPKGPRPATPKDLPAFLDALMHEETPSTLRVVLYVARNTVYLDREWVAASLGEIMRATGLPHSTVRAGLARAIEDGYLMRRGPGSGRGRTYEYALARVLPPRETLADQAPARAGPEQKGKRSRSRQIDPARNDEFGSLATQPNTPTNTMIPENGKVSTR